MLANVALLLVAFASSAFAFPTHQLEPRAGTILTGPNIAPKWALASPNLLSKRLPAMTASVTTVRADTVMTRLKISLVHRSMAIITATPFQTTAGTVRSLLHLDKESAGELTQHRHSSIS